MSVYELNALNMEAEGTTEAQRSMVADLWDGPGATRAPRWNLNYAKGLCVNWLWFQPGHPYGIPWRHLSAADINNLQAGAGATTKLWNGGVSYDNVNYAYALGSPYAVKNFFQIDPHLSKANTRAAAMQEFQDFMAPADAGGTNTMNVMLDAPFNHGLDNVESAASPTLIVYRLNPTGDFDNDGLSNLDKDTAGTNPLDGTSKFIVLTVARVGGGYQFTVPSVIGRTSTLKSRTDLTVGITKTTQA